MLCEQCQKPLATVFHHGDLTLDTVSMEARYRDREVMLTPTEFRLLTELMRRSGEALSLEYLLVNVWGESYEVGIVKVHVYKVRKALRDAGDEREIIETVNGYGYRIRGGP